MKYLHTICLLLAGLILNGQCLNDPPIIFSFHKYVEDNQLVADLVVFNFDNVASIQTGLTFNSDLLEFTEIESLLDNDWNVNTANADIGELKTLWIIGLGEAPVTLAGGSVIAKFKFNILGQGDFNIQLTPLPNFEIEVSNGNGLLLCFLIEGQHAVLQGNIFHDLDSNCELNGNETNLTNWQLNLTDQNSGQDYPVITNNDGDYYAFLSPGDYNFSVAANNSLWTLCEDSFSLSIQQTDTTYIQDFHAQSLVDCPLMQVDVNTPFLRRCFPNYYHVQYCNEGTITATDVEIDVVLDPYLSFVNSSNPSYTQNGDTIHYLIGDVAVGECANILIETYLSCDSTVLGQTHCVSAHIFPDTLCSPAPAQWSGASLQVEGNCIGDSVQFIITNTGLGDMSDPQELIVVEDDVMRGEGNIQLASGQSEFKTFEANGATYRLMVQQEPFHPGASNPTIAIEGCEDPVNEQFSVGFYTLFPEDEQDSYISIDCQENIGSFDPNDKLAYPKGYGEEKLIEKATMLEYMIRFQNTGTDTAFRVVVIDTLTEKLDLSTLDIVNTSHQADVKILGERVLSFEFDNIQLVDSTTNEPLSHGFIKYSIYPTQEVEVGDLVDNEASIYFDFNDPVITEVVSRKIGEDFFDVTSSIFPEIEIIEEEEVLLFPNPVREKALVKFQDQNIPLDLKYEIFNLDGQLVKTDSFNANERISCELIPNGMYIIQFIGNGQFVARAKFIILR